MKQTIKFILIIVLSLIINFVINSDLKSETQGIINVYQYLQCGQSWSGSQLGTCTGSTICSDGCAITCMAMLLKTNGVNVNPGQLNTYLTNNNGYSGDCLLIWDKGARYPGSSITFNGSAAYSLATIKSKIDAGNPVIVNVTTSVNHFIVVKGYNGSGSSTSDFVVLDPLYQAERLLSNYSTIVGLRTFSNVTTPTAVSATFTVNSGNSLEGWKFWKYPPAYFQTSYSVTMVISNLPTGSNWALYTANSSGVIDGVATNQSVTTFTFNFAISSTNANYPNGSAYYFRLTPQGIPTTIWAQSPAFCISTLPVLSTLTITPSSTIFVGQPATINWGVTGGVPGLPDGGWTGNIRLQWYQYGNPLPNLAMVPVANHSYTFTVPSSIPGGIIPGCNFKIGGCNAPTGTSIPDGYVSNFTSEFCIQNPSGIINISNDIPTEFSLQDNYPNPFNPSTNIKFNVAKLSDVKIIVYDVLGREVQTLVNESLKPGTYEAVFDASSFSSGVYFYKLITNEFVEMKKMILLK
ncbi:MAG TPA: C39 family peptidase [Ignavibacteria bacterium]